MLSTVVRTLANLIWSSVSVLGSHSMDGIRPAASAWLLLVVVVVDISNGGAMDSSLLTHRPLHLASPPFPVYYYYS